MSQFTKSNRSTECDPLRIVVALVVCSLSTGLCGQEPSARRPNIVFFIADDMQRYMFNCLQEGEPPYLTPNLDRIAAEGTLMTEQYVSTPVCTPSRFSCLTGRYASRSASPGLARTVERDGQSVVGWNTMIMPAEITLASLLQQAGYTTGMVGKNHVIDAPGRKKIGYREDPTDPAVAARLQADQRLLCEAMKRCGFDYASAIYHNNPDGNGPRALAVHNLDWIAQAGLSFVEQCKDQPFFLYFAVTVPHGPGDASRSWNADPRATAAGFLDQPLQILPARKSIPERLERAGLPVDDQRANMLWLDDTIGALFDKLRELNIEDNTIVIFFNDHGQKAKGTLYQGGISNPSLVWRKGGFPCGKVSRVQVCNIDFAPTILDMAGAVQPEGRFDGISFLPALEGRDDPIHSSLYFEMGFTRAVVKGNWKYLALRYPQRSGEMSIEERRRVLKQFNDKQKEHAKRIVTTDPTARFSHISLIPGGAGAEAASTGKRPGYYDADQLYNLAVDANEEHNLANDAQYADVLQEMKSELRRYLNDLPGGFAELKPNH